MGACDEAQLEMRNKKLISFVKSQQRLSKRSTAAMLLTKKKKKSSDKTWILRQNKTKQNKTRSLHSAVRGQPIKLQRLSSLDKTSQATQRGGGKKNDEDVKVCSSVSMIFVNENVV